MIELKYLASYSEQLRLQISDMIKSKRAVSYILEKYPKTHEIRTNSQLYSFVQDIKKRKMRQSAPLKNALYDSKIGLTHNALGLNTHKIISHGKKLKTQKDIRISSVFRSGPEEFLEMIVAHELAHIREIEHDKSFYKLCEHIVPSYHQFELDFRIFLTLIDLGLDIYETSS
jgi:predicted metal-dependent hydrolase